eukprot:6175228-Pleurochrysis_carterae.AAC.3
MSKGQRKLVNDIKASYFLSARLHREESCESPLRFSHGGALRFRVSTQEREGSAQLRINANAKTCKCE